MKWLGLALLGAVQFMVVLDIAIVNVALPSIQPDLDFSQSNLQWVISAYALVFGGFLLLGGRTADVLGRRRIFMAGLVLFTIGSLLCGLAWSETSLIGARAIQGLGAATISPAALAILMTTFAEGRERNIALGVWGAVGGFGAAAGVLLGGVLTDALSWEWIFFVNIPVALAAVALAPVLLRESRDTRVKTFDALGAVLVTGGLSLLVLAITQGHGWGWDSARTIGVFAASAALLVGFVAWENRVAEPLMRFGILRTKTVLGANVAGLHPRHRPVLDVPDADAVHAAGARLLGDEDRRRVPRRRRHLDHLGERRRGAREPRRRQAADRGRDGAARRRDAPVHADPGRRHVRRRTCCRAS